MAGINISAKPTTMVFEAAVASGTPSSSKNGMKGWPSRENTEVYSAITKAIVPSPITTGSTPNTISTALRMPSPITDWTDLTFAALVKASSMPQENAL
ncbi:Uncharacterised protein [Vibrio cholerae]|nr:Uncharacterised protein [Vibrio cholerae]CSA39198.1 Uncharacterised protein [Vibrio cholerae]CSB55472.1 Uncharacterised protein [Vibrio cholerae]CSB90931.1 Uncharacterised protein [Vibrio cholerae]CSB94663.1 Uncharacterised protein [Vibrio cholerae]